jgi:hypothetical protein
MPNVTFRYVHPHPEELRAAIDAMEASNPNTQEQP